MMPFLLLGPFINYVVRCLFIQIELYHTTIYAPVSHPIM